jgi:hypothetical protein
MPPIVKVTIPDGVEVSDGYHTFTELYEHRCLLWIAFCKLHGGAWKSRVHSDGSKIDGWFLLGLGTKRGHQATYHLPDAAWNITSFAQEFEIAPEFDGHTSEVVMDRLKAFVLEGDDGIAKRLCAHGIVSPRDW